MRKPTSFVRCQSPRSIGCLVAIMLGGAVFQGLSEEGMWLFNSPPREMLRETYGFDPSAAWLEHLQKASIRFGNGGSASFVSKAGLLISNQHVGSRTLQRLSTRESDLISNGFYAATLAEEKPCPGVELWVLMNIEDVTAKVNEAVAPGLADEAAFKARRAAMAEIEKNCSESGGRRGEVVTLFQGAEYHLYTFKRYTDVRLVFAPEEQIAFFGGDADNFEYPRYNLDVCFFRAYEDGQPARVDHYLKWSSGGPSENELVFVSGSPGRTDRLRTLAEVEYLRDKEYPRMLERLKRTEVLLHAYSQRSSENARRARGDLRSVENSRKVRDGTLAGLLDPQLIARKSEVERQFRAAVAARADLAPTAGAWDRIAAAQREIAQRAQHFDLLENGAGFNSHLFSYARQLLRAGEEREKANGERLEEYRSTALASVELGLMAEQPIYADLETLKLADGLTYLAEKLGAGHALVKRVLSGQSPRERASQLVRGTRLATIGIRRELYEGGSPAVEKSADPMIELARVVDDEARAVRKFMEVQREAVRQAHAAIGRARYALYGARQYPDATSSLRLAFGTAKGYQEEGRNIPFQTVYRGLYERAGDHKALPPFDLPAKWEARRDKLDLSAPFNFVSTADIIGGNSGSPVVNRTGEFVGIIFDGNIQSLISGFAYTAGQSRAVAVHSKGILEALGAIYGAQPLVEELLGSVRK